MENRKIDFQEEWIKLIKNGIPEGEYIITNLIEDLNGVKILLLNEKEDSVEIIFDGFPVLVRSASEGLRMRTWGNVQQKYNNKPELFTALP